MTENLLKLKEWPAVKHARDNDDEILHEMFRNFSTTEMLQEIAARMADDTKMETVHEAQSIGLSLSFDPLWVQP
jgi:hypothetical protein